MSRQFATNVTTIYDIFCPVPSSRPLLDFAGFCQNLDVENFRGPVAKKGLGCNTPKGHNLILMLVRSFEKGLAGGGWRLTGPPRKITRPKLIFRID